MTGFGKEVIETPFRKITVEIRTLNSKQLDLNLRTPMEFRAKEPEIRSLVSKSLQRGKVDFGIQVESVSSDNGSVINKELVKHYYDEMVEVAKSVGQNDFSGFLPVIVKMPDVFVQKVQETNDEEWAQIKTGVLAAIAHVDDFRKEEGAILEKDLVQRIDRIDELLLQVASYEQERPAIVKERIRKRLEEWGSDAEIDQNRLEQEMIY